MKNTKLEMRLINKIYRLKEKCTWKNVKSWAKKKFTWKYFLWKILELIVDIVLFILIVGVIAGIVNKWIAIVFAGVYVIIYLILSFKRNIAKVKEEQRR